MINVTQQHSADFLVVHTQAPASLDTTSVTECRLYLERVVGQIDSARVRRVVGAVFQDLTRLLECLTIIEGHLRHIHTAEESLAFFQLIRDEAKSLLEFIRTDALNCDQISGELADTLDGITFALSHDLRRVFEGENEVTGDKPPYILLGRVHRAHDVLTNCLQQSTISLAVIFDRTLVGTKLFNNSEKRYQQSVKLCSDLTELRELVQEFIDSGAAHPPICRLVSRSSGTEALNSSCIQIGLSLRASVKESKSLLTILQL